MGPSIILEDYTYLPITYPQQSSHSLKYHNKNAQRGQEVKQRGQQRGQVSY